MALLNYTLIYTNVPQKVRFAIYYEWEKGPNSLENSQNSEFKSNLGPDIFFWILKKTTNLGYYQSELLGMQMCHFKIVVIIEIFWDINLFILSFLCKWFYAWLKTEE